MKRLLLTATIAGAAAALVAGCSPGSTPTLPSAPAPSSSAAPSPSPTPTRAGCSNNDTTRVQSYAPGSPLPAGDAAGSTVAEIRKNKKIRVGVSADNLLFGFRNPITGQLEGFDIDMVNAVAHAIFGPDITGKIEYRVENFAQRIPDLQSGRVDLVADIMTINCSRWSQIAFSSEYFHAGQQVLVRKNSPYKGIADLNGKKVCTATGSTGEQNLKTLYPKVVREVVANISDCMVLFQQGTVEGVVSDNTVVAGFASQDPYARIAGDKFTQEPYGLGIPARNVDFVQFVNTVLQDMRTNGEWAKLYHKWLPGPVPSPPPAVYGRALPL
jgi:polar amino acid transport system substrate-binding protein